MKEYMVRSNANSSHQNGFYCILSRLKHRQNPERLESHDGELPQNDDSQTRVLMARVVLGKNIPHLSYYYNSSLLLIAVFSIPLVISGFAWNWSGEEIQETLELSLQDVHGAAGLPRESLVSHESADDVVEITQESRIEEEPQREEVPPPLHDEAYLSHVGVYLSPSSVKKEKFFVETMDDLLEAGGDALIIDVKGSAVYFDADVPMAKELGLLRPQYDLATIIQKAKDRGIYTLARFVAIKDGGLTAARPDTIIKNPSTGRQIGFEWVDPENEVAQEYNQQVLCELAKAGIDEINLDYIRFSTAEVGALRVYSGSEKAKKVESFVRMARDTIDACGSDTKLGISTYAILGWNYDINVETLGQDVVAFAPLVDVISPMAYPATFAENAYYDPSRHPISRMYYLVWRTLTGYQELLGPEQAKKLRPWIQGYSVNTKNMQDQMKAVYDAGLCGFTVWSAGNSYGYTYSAMKTWERPDGCVM